MKPAMKDKWVKALRSGKFEQCNSVLHDGKTGYCCLGVLRHVADPKDKRSQNNDHAFLSRPQLKQFGLTDKVQIALADLNDDKVPFEVIAGLIDEAL